MLFISYSRRELYFAEYISLHLQKAGIAVWFDLQQLEPGIHWKLDIDAGLSACAGLLLIASESALASPYVELEWQRALSDKKPVFVLLFENVKLPPALEQVGNLIDCRSDTDAGLRDLLALIKQGTRRTVISSQSSKESSAIDKLRQSLIRRTGIILAIVLVIAAILYWLSTVINGIAAMIPRGLAVLIVLHQLSDLKTAYQRYRRLGERLFPDNLRLLKEGGLLLKKLGDKQLKRWIRQNREQIIRAKNHEVPNRIRIMMYASLIPDEIPVTIYDHEQLFPYIMVETRHALPFRLYGERSSLLGHEIITVLEIAGLKLVSEEEDSKYQLVILSESLDPEILKRLLNQYKNVIGILCDNKDYFEIDNRLRERQIIDFRSRKRGVLAAYFAYLHHHDLAERAVLSLNLAPTNLQIEVTSDNSELFYRFMREPAAELSESNIRF
jgi:hypothetical protein